MELLANETRRLCGVVADVAPLEVVSFPSSSHGNPFEDDFWNEISDWELDETFDFAMYGFDDDFDFDVFETNVKEPSPFLEPVSSVEEEDQLAFAI